uniref:B-like cyclin n=1 Tax=Chenopodium quinoa TaxID=63459 RepID=A0A803N5J4_CHEQI
MALLQESVPIARNRLQISNDQKRSKSKSICNLDKSFGTTPARKVKVDNSVAKTLKSTGSLEEVAGRGIPAKNSDNLQSQSSETTVSKNTGRRKSYTYSLISRSKLLKSSSEVREHELLPNIDDEGNPLEVAEYVDDIYEYYWIMEVHFKFDLMPETLYLTVALLDRYLSVVTIKKNEFQLIGLASLLLASKYEDFWHPKVKDLISISAESYTRKQMLEMEKSILKKLKFRLNLPTAYVFMLRFLKASQSDKRHERLSFYLIELCLVEYETLRFRPSLLCAAAVYVARCTLYEIPGWTSLLGKHTHHEEHQIRQGLCGDDSPNPQSCKCRSFEDLYSNALRDIRPCPRNWTTELWFGYHDEDDPSEFSADSHPSDYDSNRMGLPRSPSDIRSGSSEYPGYAPPITIPGLFPPESPLAYSSAANEVLRCDLGINRAISEQLEISSQEDRALPRVTHASDNFSPWNFMGGWNNEVLNDSNAPHDYPSPAWQSYLASHGFRRGDPYLPF